MEATEVDYDSVLPSVMQTIRAALSLSAQDPAFYSSVDPVLGEKIKNSANSLLDLASKLISNSDPNTDIELASSSELNWKPISDILDSIFEKIDIAFDKATKKTTTSTDQYTYLEEGSDDLKAAGKRTQKPQLNFKTPVNNTEKTPFKPKLTSKPNALVPLDQCDQLVTPSTQDLDSSNPEDSIDPPYYPQPYSQEIDQQPYPESILTHTDPIPFKDWNSTSAIWVDSVKTLNEMIESLKDCTEIAVDLEHHDYRTYYGLVCLMQISSRDQDWIVDTLVLRDELSSLNTIFTNPNIIKVFHGAFMDIIWLQRDLGLYIVSLFDTFHASKKLGLSKFSLAYLLENFANFKTSKKYQLSDWRIRPLPPAMLAYARSDTHFLLNIFDQLKNKLLTYKDNRMQQVLHESRQVAKRRFEYTKFRPSRNGLVSCPIMASNPKEPYISLMTQYNVSFSLKPMVEVLYNWRDEIARVEDESVRYVMPNQLLVNLATLSQPIDSQKVLSSSNYVTEYVRVHAQGLAELLSKTFKSIEEKDWELVDQWNDQQHGVDLNEFNEENIEKYSDYFEQLLEQDDELLRNDQQINLIKAESKIFNDLLDKEIVTIEIVKSEVTKHNFNQVLGERYTKTLAELRNLDNSLKIEAEEEEEEEKKEKEEAPKVEIQDQGPDLPPYKEEKKLDPNEIITLRKRQHQTKPKKEAAEVKPAVDYTSADKILLDVKRPRDKNQKKRSFDPFMKESEGPKPAKKKLRITAGKTSTFLNKKK